MKKPDKAEDIAREILTAHPISGTLSVPRKNLENSDTFDKIRLRPVQVSGKTLYQLEQFRGAQVFHRNVNAEELEGLLSGYLGSVYTRGEFATESGSIQTLTNRRGEITAIRKRMTLQNGSTEAHSHNRTKNYILQEGRPVPFLVDLGVMSADGTVIKSKYDKFRQINRFLEFVDDILPELRNAAETETAEGKTLRELTIVDFGCGKSYLTFAIYYYLSVLQKLPVRVIGLDLKKEVIEHCSALAQAYGYGHLSFSVGDIAGYQGTDAADMVITLHACDTATDFALAQAIRWNAKVILSVPCCQHELNEKLGNSDFQSPGKRTLAAAFKYGIIRERMAALFTDVMRAELLEKNGYMVQILEFIDMSHTPKNLLIRAVLQAKNAQQDGAESNPRATDSGYRTLRDFLGLAPILEKELEHCTQKEST